MQTWGTAALPTLCRRFPDTKTIACYWPGVPRPSYQPSKDWILPTDSASRACSSSGIDSVHAPNVPFSRRIQSLRKPIAWSIKSHPLFLGLLWSSSPDLYHLPYSLFHRRCLANERLQSPRSWLFPSFISRQTRYSQLYTTTNNHLVYCNFFKDTVPV